jgi:hypothetical protein
MFPGTSLVIKEAEVSDSIRLQLVTHPYFKALHNFQLQDTFIEGEPKNIFDQCVIDILEREGIEYQNTLIEYWFQGDSSGLSAHCDYNFVYREKMKLEGDDWPHKIDSRLIVSPVTLAVYLEISDDMEGGELCISHRTWWEDEKPIAMKHGDIIKYPHEIIRPVQGKILYFKGSEHYHWVNKVTKGSRKSMLINFWPKELLDK